MCSEQVLQASAAQGAADRILSIVQALAEEARPGRASRARLDSLLERDLGLDSLARVELLVRIERAFSTRLPENTLAKAETPEDLLRALAAAGSVPSEALAAMSRLPAPELAEGVPEQARTLVEVLDWHVRTHPARAHVIFYRSAEHTDTLTYEGLARGAEALAKGLRNVGLERGQAVAIMLPTCLEFFQCFYGILLAGGVPVPIYPPARPSQIEDHLRRQAGILRSCQAPILITVVESKLFARLVKGQAETLREVLTVQELRQAGAKPERIALASKDVALLQYTSGSTGNPKGVVLAHDNLLANIRAWGRAVQLRSTDVCVSWLPLYHDMGLIGTWLGSLYHACVLVLMSPLDFLARPERWLWAIHKHRATVTAAPNFAFELCLRRIDDAQIEGLDLSSWRFAANGAEPVSPDTIARFSERFARYGFRGETMAPVYGLAECAVGLTVPPLGRKPVIDSIQRMPFMQDGRAVAAADDPQALRFVACGQPLPGHEVRIVDRSGRELPPRAMGRLEFRGPSATRGYFRNPEASRALISDGWLDSGDLAYVADGDIYITSRVKDMIIRGGHNIYPYELEQAIGELPGMRKGCVAIFGVADRVAATEKLVVVAETRESDAAKLESIRARIDALAVELLGTPPDDVMLAPPHAVLKTSSGKIRRAATRELYEKGVLGRGARAIWLQFARLILAAAASRARRAAGAAGELLYAGYVWLLFAVVAVLAWTCLMVLPRPALRWSVGRFWARLFVRLSGSRLRVHGLENLPPQAPCVIVANHASYVDGIVLTAALPRPFGFIAKRELGRYFGLRQVLLRMGTQFVERSEAMQSVEDAQRLGALARAGHSLLFFAEGTFKHETGLRPFHMGAFLVAAQAGVPVVPVALRGTRMVLRAETWLPRCGGDVEISVGRSIQPTGADWSAAISLRQAARGEILQHCGEPDLAPADG